MRIKSVLYIALLTLSTVALLLSLSIVPFAIMPIMITAATILTVSFAYLWIIGAALIDAIIDGSITGTKRFIALGADVNDTDSNGHTPLHCAILFSHTEIAVALIEKDADVNATNQYGSTPLHLAAANGHTETALALIAAGADVDAADQYGRTPLKLAIINNLSEIVQALIAAGADVNTADQYGRTPLKSAIINNLSEIVQALIAAGADVDAADQFGRTPLQWAARNNKTEIAVALIANGANVNAANQHGQTPLHWAAVHGNTEIAAALIAAGADVDAADQFGRTPLQWAVMFNKNVAKYLIALSDVKTIKALIDKGYDTQAKLDDKTPLEIAIAADNLNVAKYLIARTKPIFADINMPNDDNSTTRFLKLATTEHESSAASTLTVAGNEIQNEVTTKLSSIVQPIAEINNSKIYFAKALFGMPTTDKAKEMVKFMMFNLTFALKDTYKISAHISSALKKLNYDCIGIILEFAGLSPGNIDLAKIDTKKSKKVANEKLKLTVMIPANRGNSLRSCSSSSQNSVRHG